jgi:DNA repair protein RadD
MNDDPFFAPIPLHMPGSLDVAKAKKLHPFQEFAIFGVKASLMQGHKRVMLRLPTGAGKTIIAAAMVRSALMKRKRVIFVVDAIELVNQTIDKFRKDGIEAIGVLQAQHAWTDERQPVQICTVQTLAHRAMPAADLVIIDEAHMNHDFIWKWMDSPQWKEIPFIGLSATPYTKGLGKRYSSLVAPITTQQLIEGKFLSPFRVYAPGKAAPDLSSVRTVAGEYHEGDLSKVMSKKNLVADAVESWLQFADGRPTLCYAVDCAHAVLLQEKFLSAGVPTGYIYAKTEPDERKKIAAQFASGELKVVCSVGVLVKGIDWDVRCISLCCPTKSEIKFQQIIGRGLRTAPGKDYCLILDHSTTHHDLGDVTDVDERNTSLDVGKGSKAAKREKDEHAARFCPSCKVMKLAGMVECPVCGFAAKRQNKVQHKEGELVPFGKSKVDAYTLDQRRDFYAGLLQLALERGVKKGWAAYRYQAKFGSMPRFGDIEPMAPSAMVLNWVKHEQIAFAKRKRTA